MKSRPVRLLAAAIAGTVLHALAAAAAPRVVPAPAFRLPTASGVVALDSLRGKVVYLDFWASWCQPCKKSFPWMDRLQQRYAPQGLAVVAVDLDKSREAADAFLERFPPAFVVAFDSAGKTAEAYRVPAMPTSFLIGRDGRLLDSHAGFDPRRTAEMEKSIEAALAR
jgi:thiol-disulfide isomerase/thioredoxin